MPGAAELDRRLAAIIRPRTADAAVAEPCRLPRTVQTALVERAVNQGVGVLCHERLADWESGGGLDADLYGQLRRHAQAEAVLDAHRQQCLREVFTALTAAGVNTLVFKGAALALSHYPRPHLRPRDDTDVLIAEPHLAAARRILTGLGFHRAAANQQSLIMRQYLYQRRDASGCLHNLDIHWDLNNRPGLRTLLCPQGLRVRALELPALGSGVLVPAVLDALLIACVHLQAHHAGAIRLIWLHDIALLAEALSPAERRQLRARLQRPDLAGACRLGLGLAAWYFAAPGSALAELAPAALDPETLRAPRRLRIWCEDLAALAGTSLRLRYLGQHLLPRPGYLLARAGKQSPAWLPWLYLRRAGRGIGHLWRR